MSQNVRRQYRRTCNGVKLMKSKVHRGLVIAYSPSGVSHVIAQSIVRAPDHDQEDILERFVEMKQRELATVLLSCAFVASLIASLMSWDWFPVPAVTARIAALCALIHSVVAVGIAAQQLIALTRAHIHPNRAKIMQHILFGEAIPSIPTAALDVSLTSQSTAINTGSVWRHFSWQIPTMMLGNSLVFTLVALAIAVFDEARKAVVWQTPEMVTAICVAVSLAFSVCCYFISWFCIEWQMQEAIAKDLQSQTYPRQAGITVDSMV